MTQKDKAALKEAQRFLKYATMADRISGRTKDGFIKCHLKPEHIDALTSATAYPAVVEPELQDVIDWADGVMSALGTEHKSRVSDIEGKLAAAILKAAAPEPEKAQGDAPIDLDELKVEIIKACSFAQDSDENDHAASRTRSGIKFTIDYLSQSGRISAPPSVSLHSTAVSPADAGVDWEAIKRAAYKRFASTGGSDLAALERSFVRDVVDFIAQSKLITRASLSAGQGVAVPEGYALVPIEPTYDMCKAGGFSWENPHFPTRYKAMLSVAASPATKSKPSGVE